MARMFAILLLCMALAPVSAQVAVVNHSVPDRAIDAKRMTAMLTGRITTWGDGKPIVLVFAEDRLADIHLSHIAGRDREVLLRAWKRLVFSGSGAMPLLARSSEEGLALIARTPGAVLVLDQAPADSRWRVMPIVTSPE